MNKIAVCTAFQVIL